MLRFSLTASQPVAGEHLDFEVAFEGADAPPEEA